MRTLEIPAGAIVPERPAVAPAPGETIPRPKALAKPERAGFEIGYTCGEGWDLTGTFFAAPRFEGGPGVMHGGLQATVFDECFGALGFMAHTPLVTSRLEVAYLRPLPVGVNARVHARVDAVDGRWIYMSGELYSDEISPKPIDTARALFVVIDVADHYSRARESFENRRTED